MPPLPTAADPGGELAAEVAGDSLAALVDPVAPGDGALSDAIVAAEVSVAELDEDDDDALDEVPPGPSELHADKAMTAAKLITDHAAMRVCARPKLFWE